MLSINFNLRTSIMENNVTWGFLYWDDYEEGDLERINNKSKFSDSTEDED